MSITTKQETRTTTRNVDVVVCDGPECTKSTTFDRRTQPVPPGWIFVDDSTGPKRQTKHYCSHDCLADAVVP